MLHAAGVEITFENARPAEPGVCIHEVGTCRMGSDPKTSMLNKWNQPGPVFPALLAQLSVFVIRPVIASGWRAGSVMRSLRP